MNIKSKFTTQFLRKKIVQHFLPHKTSVITRLKVYLLILLSRYSPIFTYTSIARLRVKFFASAE